MRRLLFQKPVYIWSPQAFLSQPLTTTILIFYLLKNKHPIEPEEKYG